RSEEGRDEEGEMSHFHDRVPFFAIAIFRLRVRTGGWPCFSWPSAGGITRPPTARRTTNTATSVTRALLAAGRLPCLRACLGPDELLEPHERHRGLGAGKAGSRTREAGFRTPKAGSRTGRAPSDIATAASRTGTSMTRRCVARSSGP